MTTSIQPFTRGPWALPRFSTVTEAFYHHSTAQPEAIAARDLSTNPPREITYGALAKRASTLATHLRDAGVCPGDKVPLVIKRGIDMLAGIFAILSCGAQYVPMDGGVVPDATLRFVLQQTDAKAVLCLSSTKYRLSGLIDPQRIVVTDEVTESESDNSSFNLAQPEHGCYVIYTSGTTGTPKGVDVTHQNVVNLICLSPGDLNIRPGSTVPQLLNVSFDMAAWEILGCLCNGGTLIIRGNDWSKALKEADTLICTPSILAKYNPQDYPKIKTVATAGEPSSQRLADLWSSHGTYYNCCGPTETTIVNTMHRHQTGQPLTIGVPTPNNNVYILNSEGQQVGLGEQGVMWAGGAGVSRGYVAQPEKTAGRYKPDPFAGPSSAMMYNTGDIGAWRPDGSIDMLGRVDDQIKIKGFRVELDGVTASLNASPTVDRAVALLIDDEIHAIVSPESADIEAIKRHLGSCQPYYAVPGNFHFVDTLPLTANGKIDKKGLRSRAFSNASTLAKSHQSRPSVISTDSNISGATRLPSNTSTSTLNEKVEEGAEQTVVRLDDKEKDTSVVNLSALEEGLPEKALARPYRGLVHRLLIVYRRLFTLVGLANIAAAVAVVCVGVSREWLGYITAANLTLAILMRQDFVLNAIWTICCSVPKSWPLAIRRRTGKIIHHGGVHSGAGVCAALWMLAFNISDRVCGATGTCGANWPQASIASIVVSWLLTGFFCAMLASAWPEFRKKRHDLFEKLHRFVGWTMLALFWVQVVLGAHDTLPADMTLGQACLRNPSLWMLVVATMAIISTWLFLRKVPVEAEVLSDHAVRLHFDYTVPVNGTFTRLSFKPLLEWHSFATIPAPEAVNGRPKGYSLVVSNAGDWTKQCIQKGPTKVWVRGVPVCGVMRITTLFKKVVVIATGSGIGPCLGHLQDPPCDTELIWSTPNPEKTFGSGIIDSIKAKVPNSVIWNTKIQGRPDLVKMGYNMAKKSGAEAVVIIANEKITKKIIYGLETRGVPAYGAIWDS